MLIKGYISRDWLCFFFGAKKEGLSRLTLRLEGLCPFLENQGNLADQFLRVDMVERTPDLCLLRVTSELFVMTWLARAVQERYCHGILSSTIFSGSLA